jgi:fatty-acyl-CoA synthase
VELLIGDIFCNAARAAPERTAAALGDASMTYDELHRSSNRTARAISALGIGHHDRVAVWAATSLDTVPVFAALAKLGAVFAPVNALFGVDEATEMASVAQPSLALVDQSRADAGVELATRLGVECVVMPDLLTGAATLPDSDIHAPGLSEHDPHVIFFTSGSTGRSKGVVLSHRANYLRTYHGPLLEPKGPMVCMFPMFHMAPWTIALQQWHARETIVFVESADAVTLCDAIARHRATRFYGIPAVWRRILDHLSAAGDSAPDLSSLRIADTGTSATPPELLDEIEAALPQAVLRVFYGSTEAGNVAQLDHADMRRKPASVGVPAPTTEVRVDEDGEVWVRGPLVFEEYFDNPAATADAIVDGWYRTGDLAEVDGDGFLTIVGRARDVIRTGGETVSPSEVEAVVGTCPGVDDVAVIGMPHPEWGEVVCAVVSCAANAPSLDELRAHCDGKLARFKQPKRLEVVAAIPRTAATGQVQRRLLVELLS